MMTQREENIVLREQLKASEREKALQADMNAKMLDELKLQQERHDREREVFFERVVQKEESGSEIKAEQLLSGS